LVHAAMRSEYISVIYNIKLHYHD